MNANQTKQKNDLPDCWKQSVNVLLVLMISACFMVLALTFIPHTEGLYRFAVAAMYAMGISVILTVEWAIRSPSSPIFPPGFKPFNNALSTLILAAVVAAMVALLTVTIFSTVLTKTSWAKPTAEVLVTRITFSNSPYIPLAPPRLRIV